MTVPENPRWTACRKAIGREPECWEFSLWIQKRWHDYAAHLGLAELNAAYSGAYARVSSWYWFEKKVDGDELARLFNEWLDGSCLA